MSEQAVKRKGICLMWSRYSPKTKNNVGFTQHKNVDIAKGKAFAILSGHVPVQVTIEIRQHINDFLSRDSLAGEEVMLMVCTFDHDSYPKQQNKQTNKIFFSCLVFL